MIRIDVKSDDVAALESYGVDTSARVMEELRLELERLQDVNFERKSKPKGGLGTDGISWGPHSEAWEKRKGHDVVGFHTGKMRALVNTGFTDDTVFYEYVTDHAEHFDQRWPLIPDELPDTWAEAMQDAAVVWMEDELEQLFAA